MGVLTVEQSKRVGMADKKNVETRKIDPFLYELMIVCNPCGSLMKGSWVSLEGGRQVAIAVEKCSCDPSKETPADAVIDGDENRTGGEANVSSL